MLVWKTICFFSQALIRGFTLGKPGGLEAIEYIMYIYIYMLETMFVNMGSSQGQTGISVIIFLYWFPYIQPFHFTAAFQGICGEREVVSLTRATVLRPTMEIWSCLDGALMMSQLGFFSKAKNGFFFPWKNPLQ